MITLIKGATATAVISLTATLSVTLLLAAI